MEPSNKQKQDIGSSTKKKKDRENSKFVISTFGQPVLIFLSTVYKGYITILYFGIGCLNIILRKCK